MNVFLTGATGYLGGYLTDRLLRQGQTVTILVRASDADAARMRLWRALQLHMSADILLGQLDAGRLRFVLGDICAPRLGLSPEGYQRVVEEHDTVVHSAATLNRRSPRSCMDVNLRGGLAVLNLARAIQELGRLRRYVFVSTVAVAGQRQRQVVGEDEAIAWDRSDWDPYARTKKFGEHLTAELLPAGSFAIARPSIVLGDSRFPETTQFDMTRAFVGLARLPILPFDPEARLDIVPADFVADGLAHLVTAPKLEHAVYHLSAGASAPTFRDITSALAAATGRRPARYAPRLGGLAARGIKLLANARHPWVRPVRAAAALMDVFWPYLDWDVVFDNQRIEREANLRPAPFPGYCAGLMAFARQQRFTYPYRPMPPMLAESRRGEWTDSRAPALSARSGC